MCLKFHFLELVTKTCGALKVNSHLRNSCRRLRIVHVAPQIDQVMRIFKRNEINHVLRQQLKVTILNFKQKGFSNNNANYVHILFSEG